MPALSTKDKMRLRISAKRVERWHKDMLKPADNGKKRCQGVVFGYTGDKPQETIREDRHAELYRLTDGHSMRMAVGKTQMRKGRENFHDYQDAGYSEMPREPEGKAIVPKIARQRKASPFKKTGRWA